MNINEWSRRAKLPYSTGTTVAATCVSARLSITGAAWQRLPWVDAIVIAWAIERAEHEPDPGAKLPHEEHSERASLRQAWGQPNDERNDEPDESHCAEQTDHARESSMQSPRQPVGEDDGEEGQRYELDREGEIRGRPMDEANGRRGHIRRVRRKGSPDQQPHGRGSEKRDAPPTGTGSAHCVAEARGQREVSKPMDDPGPDEQRAVRAVGVVADEVGNRAQIRTQQVKRDQGAKEGRGPCGCQCTEDPQPRAVVKDVGPSRLIYLTGTVGRLVPTRAGGRSGGDR